MMINKKFPLVNLKLVSQTTLITTLLFLIGNKTFALVLFFFIKKHYSRKIKKK